MFSERFKTGIPMFGGLHIFMLCLFLGIAVLTVVFAKRLAARKWADKLFRYGICAFAVIIELTYWGWNLFYIKESFLEILPFELCAITLWLTVIGVCFNLQSLLKLTFFWGTAGPLLSLMVVQIDYAPPHFRFFHYFFVHFSFMLLNIYMVASGKVKITFLNSVISFGALAALAGVMVLINYLLGTNYMYVTHLPAELAAVENAIGYWYLPLFAAAIFAVFQGFYGLKALCGVIRRKAIVRRGREAA